MPPVFGPEIAVEGALVVLGGADLQRVAAVAQGEEARLLAGQELLDHERAAGLPERSTHGGPDGIQRLVVAGRDHYPLAGREPVGLDDDGQRMLADIGLGSGSLAAARRSGSVRSVCHAARRSALVKAFEPSSRAAAALGPKALIPAASSRSTIPSTRGNSGPTTTRSIAPLPRQGHDAVQVVHRQPDALGDLRDPGIARGAEDARHGW